ncbi:MAG: hypothetical protein NTX50_16715 [Candidatus Sumerlaeota bacterium]|nr:hypothetical protein [Candidatus Sumerlaeota bacterium]
MFHRSRILALAISCLLLAGASASLRAAEDSLVGVPHGANIVLSLNFKDIRDQPDSEKDIQKMIDDVGGEAAAKWKEFKEKTGVDPLKDLESVGVGIYLPADKNSGKDPQVVAIINGKLDAAKLTQGLQALASADGKTMEKKDYNGVAVYSPKDQPKEGCWAVTGQSFVFSNAQSQMEKSLDALKAKTSASTDPKLTLYLAAAKKTSTFWGAGFLPEKPAPAAGQQPAPMGGDPTEMMKDFTISFDGKSGADLDIKITCKDAASALQIKNQVEMFRGMIGMGLTQGGKVPAEAATKLGIALQKITVTATNDKINLTFKLTKAETDELKQTIETVRKAMLKDAQGAGAGTDPGVAPGKSTKSAPPAGF